MSAKAEGKSRKSEMALPAKIDLGDGASLYVESSQAVPLVSIVVSMRSGALIDPPGKDGICRFTARMLRRGTQGMTATEIESAIDLLGGELSLEVGPSTTSLHAQVIRRNLRPFCDLLVKIISTPAFADDELARLRRESVAELLDARDSDRSLANVAFRRAMFESHPYARGASGRPSTLETFDKNDVIAAYKRHFVRSDAIIGFAGAIDETEAREFGALLASAIPDGPPADRAVADPSMPGGRRLVFVDKPERTQTQILMGTLGTWPHDPDHFPLVLATAVLGGTFTSRMMREIRSKRGWSYGTSARLSVERKRHAFAMHAAPASNDCAPCVKLELELLDTFVEDGITARELTFIKNYLVRSHAFEIDTAPKRLGQVLEGALIDLPDDYHAKYLDHVRAVELGPANASIRARLSPRDVVIVVVGTASELFEKVKEAIPGLAHAEVVPFDRD